MEPVLLGWPPDGPTLRLDYRRFSYAGKFVMSSTGKAILRTDDSASTAAVHRDGDSEFAEGIVAAVAFDADRTDPKTLRIRYVTVREDCRGDGYGPRLCRFLADRAADRGYERLRIAVNNPFAYEALYRAGFVFSGETTGLAELVLSRPADRPATDRSERRYRTGLRRYRERDLSDAERAFLERKAETGPPPVK